MTRRKRRQYTDKFRAGIVVQLEAAGYPDKKGALTRVAKANNVHARTISRWFWAENNPPPDEVVNEKRFDLIEALNAEIEGILESMPGARRDALYRELGTVLGIVIDKKQLLEGKPTGNQIVQTVEYIVENRSNGTSREHRPAVSRNGR